jgi:uncharacterized protein YdaU (DUF1376 family)
VRQKPNKPGKPPAFQFYPADYLADMRVRMLSWAARGLYIELICYCWREGWIPADGSAIAQLCGCHDTAIIEPCLELFSPHPTDPGKLIHLRLDEERRKQEEHSAERRESGRNGALKRWGKRDGSAINQPMAENGSSSSSSILPPLFPLPGETHDQGRYLPKGWRSMSREERKRRRVEANSPAMETIGGFFGRRPSTLWSVAEAVALLEVKPTPEEVELLARYYREPMDKEHDYRRRDLITLLNNWQTEIDRARSHYANSAA